MINILPVIYPYIQPAVITAPGCFYSVLALFRTHKIDLLLIQVLRMEKGRLQLCPVFLLEPRGICLVPLYCVLFNRGDGDLMEQHISPCSILFLHIEKVNTEHNSTLQCVGVTIPTTARWDLTSLQQLDGI